MNAIPELPCHYCRTEIKPGQNTTYDGRGRLVHSDCHALASVEPPRHPHRPDRSNRYFPSRAIGEWRGG